MADRHIADGYGVLRHMRAAHPDRAQAPGRRAMMAIPDGAVFPSAFLLPFMKQVRVRDQLQEGSCVGQTYAECADYELAKVGKLGIDTETSSQDAYDVARIAGGVPLYEDVGSTGSDMMEGARVYGVAREIVLPYTGESPSNRSDEVAQDASKRKLDLDLVCPTMATIKHALMQDFAVATGFTCFEGLMSREAAQTGKIPAPEPGERDIGGHEMTVCGWDDQIAIGRSGGVWILRQHWNEWGATYDGVKSYGLLPYDYLTHGLMGDSHCPRIIEVPA